MTRLRCAAALAHLLVLALLSQPTPGRAEAESASAGSPAQTAAVLSPPGEEFSALMPAPPEVNVWAAEGEKRRYTSPDNGVTVEISDGYELSGGGKVKEHRTYTLYAGGVVYVVESYRSPNPEKVLRALVSQYGKNYGEPSGEVKRDGFRGKQFLKKLGDAYLDRQLFLVGQHVYVFIVAARAENEATARFLSSIKLFKAPPAKVAGGQQAPPGAGAVGGPGAAAGPVFSSKELTRRAVLVWKPEPSFTDEARAHSIQGLVRLKLVLASTGEVRDVLLEKVLPHGLTEQAVRAARAIKFLPAEKDGQPVSQRVTIEYNFNVY